MNQINTTTPMQLIGMAMEGGLDVDKLERLIAFQERFRAEDARQVFNAALAACQSEIPRIAPDASNPQTRSKYASYAALDNAIRPVYTSHGFSLSFSTGSADAENVELVCTVAHSGGHTAVYRIPMPCDGKGAKGGDVMTRTHAMGSAMSYGMRYLLKMIFNIAVGEFDDDGNGAAMAEGVLQLNACNDLQTLSDTYKALFRQAQTLRDSKLMSALTAAKDKRKADLS